LIFPFPFSAILCSEATVLRLTSDHSSLSSELKQKTIAITQPLRLARSRRTGLCRFTPQPARPSFAKASEGTACTTYTTVLFKLSALVNHAGVPRSPPAGGSLGFLDQMLFLKAMTSCIRYADYRFVIK